MVEGRAVRLRVRLLGPVELYDAVSGSQLSLPSAKAREVLARLASARGQAFSIDELVEHLWGADLEARRTTLKRAQASLRGRIAELRHLHPLLKESLCTTPHGYCFEQNAAIWVDIEEFDQCCERGRALAQQKRFAEARAVLERAVHLYRGDFLAEEPYADWAIALREHWRERVAEVRALLADCYQKYRGPQHQTLVFEQLPWVGRERELAILAEHFRRARSGHTTCVLIAGESGVGKTRLVHEFLASLGRSQKLTALYGRADAAAQNVAYFPIRYALEFLHPSRSQLSALSPFERAAAAEIVPELRTHWPDLPGLAELPAAQARRRCWEGLTQLFRALQPLVLFVDDLQWADPSTLELLGYLLAQGKLRMLLVGCYRREEISPQLATLVERARAVGEVLPLERLSRAEVERLLSQAKIPEPALAKRIYHETQGNPFFIVTVLQHLVSVGVLRPHQERWVLTVRDLSTDYSKLFIPPTLHQTIRQRLAQLDARERQCLETAAILGHEFDYELLGRAWPDDGALSETIARLLSKHWLCAHATPERVRYAFAHEKLREVIMEQLAPERRQRLHERALRALEAEREAPAALLAQHAYRAKLWQEAVEHALRALKQAVQAYHHQEGLELARLGLEAAQQLERAGHDLTWVNERRFELLAQRVEIYNTLGRHREQERDLAELERLAMSDPAKRALALLKRSALHWKLGAYAQAAHAACQAQDLCEQLGDLAGQASALNLLGNAAWAQGDYSGAIHRYEGVLALRQRLGDRRGEGPAWGNLGAAYYKLGQYTEALRCHQQNLQISREVGDRRSEAVSLSNLGSVALSLGHYSEALRSHRQALAIRREIADRPGQANSLVIIGHIYASLGQYTHALRSHRHAHRLAQQVGEPRGLAIALSNLGHTCYELGDFDGARQAYHQSLEIYRRLGARLEQGLKLYDLGNLWCAVGEPQRALEYFAQAEALFAELGTEVERAMTRSAQALAHLALGQRAEALRSSSQALAALEQRGEVCEHHVEILFHHYHVLKAHQDPQAHQYLQRAYEELMRRAQQIPERRLRRSFLGNVALHREIIEAYHGRAELTAKEQLRERLRRARISSESVQRVGEAALALARGGAPITAEKLCELTSYSRPTVNLALRELCRLKLLAPVAGREGGRGRKATFIVTTQIDNTP